MTLTIEQIAEISHETNRQYCKALCDNSQPAWKDAPEWQRESAVNGVMFHKANPDAPDSASHGSWLAQKEEDGWVYGEVKDEAKKTHPCFIPFDELPKEQQRKDALFRGVVRALL